MCATTKEKKHSRGIIEESSPAYQLHHWDREKCEKI